MKRRFVRINDQARRENQGTRKFVRTQPEPVSWWRSKERANATPAEEVALTRKAQGLPDKIQDPLVLAQAAKLILARPATPS